MNSDQVINGLIKYADAEIMGKLPTTGKWIAGTAIGIASNRANQIVDVLKENTIVRMLGIIDEKGDIDVDTLINAMKESANKYGKLTVDVPMIGRLTFSSSDVDMLRNYMA